MRTRSPWYYEARVIFGWTAILPILLLPAYSLLQLLDSKYNSHVTPSLYQLMRTFEFLLPLTVSLASSHLMAVEREERFADLRATYPEPSWWMPGIRTLGALLLGMLMGLLPAVAFKAAGVPFSLQQFLLPAVAPTLFMLGLTLVVSTLSGNYWGAAGGAMAYWAFEAVSDGRVTRLLFLFDATNPIDIPYGLNRWLLTSLGLALIGLNLGINIYRRRKGI